MLVAGHQAGDAAKAAAQIAGVTKVLHADAPHLGEFLAENVAALVVAMAKELHATSWRRRRRTARTSCRASRRCSTCSRSPTSSAVESADTFVRPIYAGNALATVKSKDPIKVITVRTTASMRWRPPGAMAVWRAVQAPADSGLSQLRRAAKSPSPSAPS